MNATRRLSSAKEGNDFVDRQEEMNRLEAKMMQVTDGIGQMVLLEGEAGVGKSRLAQEFTDRCSEQGFEIFKGRCPHYSSTDPYLPFTEAMGDYLREDTSADDGTGGSLVPMGLVGFRVEEEELSELPVSDKREMMFDRVVSEIIKHSKNNPILFYIDDLQWIDDASAQLFHHLGRHSTDERVLILGAYRGEELKSSEGDSSLAVVLDRMKEEKLVDLVKVERLDMDETSKIITNKLHADDLPESFLSTIYRVTEGNPYYVLEMLNSMLDEGVIDPYSYIWDPERDLSELSIPASIKDITDRRVEKLPKGEKKVLMFASVIGTEFNFEVLERCIDMDVMELLDLMDNLKESGLIHEIEGGVEEVYRFSHVQTRAAVYKKMSKTRKRVLHLLVGKTIEEVVGDEIEKYYYPLSKHFYEGKNFGKAYEYSVKAGKRTMNSYAIESAVEYYRRALLSLAEAGDIEDAGEKKEELLRLIGNLSYDTSEWGRAITSFEGLVERAKKIGDRKLEQAALRKIGHIYRDMQKYESSKRQFEKALEIAEDIGDTEGIADSNRGLGYIHWRSGEFHKAIEYYELAIEKAKDIKNKRILALTYIERGNVYSTMGQNDLAVQYYQLSLPTLNETNSYKELARAYNNIGDVYMKMEDWDKAIEHFEKCAENAEMISNKKALGWSYFNSAEALACRGDVEEAKKYARKAENVLNTLSDNLGLSGVYKVMGIANRVAGDLEKALEDSLESLKILEGLDVPVIEGETRFAVGRVYEDLGDIETAKGYYLESKMILDKIGEGQFLEKVNRRLEKL